MRAADAGDGAGVGCVGEAEECYVGGGQWGGWGFVWDV